MNETIESYRALLGACLWRLGGQQTFTADEITEILRQTHCVRLYVSEDLARITLSTVLK